MFLLKKIPFLLPALFSTISFPSLSMEDSQYYLNEFPDELLIKIASYLEAEELDNFLLAYAELDYLSEDLWELLCVNHFGLLEKPAELSWRVFYYEEEQSRKPKKKTLKDYIFEKIAM